MPYEFASSDHPIQDKDTEESPWDDAHTSSSTTASHADAEWTRLSSGFQTAGYREGITAGKEGALQEGFDAGFAQAGAPRGHELGLLRGLAGALLLHLSQAQTATQTQTRAHSQTPTEEREHEQVKMKAAGTLQAVREIVNALAAVQFADIAPPPPPEEAEHLHAHGVGEGEEERGSSTRLESPAHSTKKPTIEDVRALRMKLETLLREAGLKVDLNLESSSVP